MERLESAGPAISRRDALAILARAEITLDDVSGFVRESAHGYTRMRVARTDAFEVLVMTWRAGQGSVAHDHAGSICALRVLSGRVTESHFRCALDGLVDCVGSSQLCEGEVIVDHSADIHALFNDADATETVVTLHLYAPPLPELRRFATRGDRGAPSGAFVGERAPEAPVVAVIGGGFSGTLTATHLLRRANLEGGPLHVALLDRQAAFGEGPAYRTPDPQHLLNVPAASMSAWPDRPQDFLRWAQVRDPSVRPYDFLPRKRYGEYVRGVLLEEASAASRGVSLESRRVEIDAVERRDDRWLLSSGGEPVIAADALVLATGHRPPDDPLASRWTGSQTRYVQDPWATLVLSAIRPDETVVLLGCGLTAIDVVMSLTKSERTAPVLAVSRRGLLPAGHAEEPLTPIDPSPWLEPLLASGAPSARQLLRAMRVAAARARETGRDWRGVIDGLRPHTTRIWQALPEREARRFLRLVRPYWEVHRHRTAPVISEKLAELQRRGLLVPRAARVLRAVGSTDGVLLDLQRRGGPIETIRADWVVNCTGPGASASVTPVVRSLVEGGFLELDALGLGVRTDGAGRALVSGVARSDLLVVGTLRKADSWESTAVPELRVQAAEVGRTLELARGEP